ncbi:MAG TPA: hypothetical protein VFI18_09880 [Gaiellales bacterium]|nr:hypothetical protein [Gaiellales bacterium]
MDAPTFDCAICAVLTRGTTQLLAMGYGVSIWLCPEHASAPFQRLHEGRAFAEALERVWAANGCLTTARRRALAGHTRALRPAEAVRPRPGSYTWAALRQEAERRFAAGEPPRPVIDGLQELVAGSGANPPSLRTMMRWYAERRWLTSAGRRGGPGGP